MAMAVWPIRLEMAALAPHEAPGKSALRTMSEAELDRAGNAVDHIIAVKAPGGEAFPALDRFDVVLRLMSQQKDAWRATRQGTADQGLR